ncbi:type II membrane protein [Saxophila tyrrhenica]|uniref:Autophagy-related protein 27 n=1 Tax=Saxophila tyrrhenica TaxID=1690608 RepID=A0AAV9P2I8_9PEZI|nr:type II membrane protein [Saxophila tyrrhenica]
MPLIWQTALLLLPTLTSAITFDCKHIRDDGASWNLEKLGGPKTVHRIRWERPSIENTTFTLDICGKLPKDEKLGKGENCLTGTQVCAREWDYPSSGKGFVKKVIEIAGEYKTSHGRSMDPKITRLKGAAGNSENKEGVLVELHGGKYPNERSGTPQKAIIEFICDKSVTGNEGFEKEEGMSLADPGAYGVMTKRKDDDDDDGPDLPNPDEYKNLKFLSYKPEGDMEVLRLRWKTKYACESAKDNPDPDDDDSKKSSGWGFFTWFLIVLFMLVAAYIIFGSWLNYNRYGARGWDLIPHGDTIRDIPYIVKDWGSNMADRMKGGDSRVSSLTKVSVYLDRYATKRSDCSVFLRLSCALSFYLLQLHLLRTGSLEPDLLLAPDPDEDDEGDNERGGLKSAFSPRGGGGSGPKTGLLFVATSSTSPASIFRRTASSANSSYSGST